MGQRPSLLHLCRAHRVKGVFHSTRRASAPAVGTAIAMSAELIPPNPTDVMVVRNVTPNIVTFSVPFFRFGKIKIGGRGTLVALTEAAKAKVSDMGGSVGYIVALDIEHHLFLSEWAKQYPSAKLIGPEDLENKRQKQQNDAKIGSEKLDIIFTKDNKHQSSISPEFDADFAYEYCDGHANLELVFLYRPDRVLIEADLMFNLPTIEQYSKAPEEDRKAAGIADTLFQGLQSTHGDAKWMRRFNWYLAAKDRPSLNASLRVIDSWDFTTLIPCHGDVLEGDGKEVFRKVFKWHLSGENL